MPSPSDSTPTDRSQLIIETKDLQKTFIRGEEEIRALDSVSLKITPGEFVAIIGPSGSGKSTLMYILGLLDSPTSGSYLLDGQDTASLSDDKRAQLRNQTIGFVFQSFHLLPRATAARNVAMPLVYASNFNTNLSAEEMRKRSMEALRRVGLENRLNHRPNELSGGQRQRVAIARALVNEPKILFADEPTGNLDSKSGEEILSLFGDLHRTGTTVIMVTHDMAIAKRASRIVKMFDGKIVEDTYAHA